MLDFLHHRALKNQANYLALYDELLAGIHKETPEFTLDWTFAGTRHFILHEPELAAQRDWLLAFLTAFETMTRDDLKKELERLKGQL